MLVLETEETRLCDSCDKEKPKRLVHRSRDTGKLVCTACYVSDLAPRVECASCGRFAPVAKWLEDGSGICKRCYAESPERMEECAKCSNERPVGKRQPDGSALCYPCDHGIRRLENTARRNRERKANYDRNRDDPHNVRRSGQEWTTEEMDLITAPDRSSDRKLSSRLGRSVQAIQVKRVGLKAAV